MTNHTSPTVAVIGCGHWGRNLLRNFNNLTTVKAVCDTTPAGRELAAQIAPQAEILSDFEQTLQTAVDGVVIATPAETHFDLACQALAAGKHVFAEKPLALTYEQGAQMVALARRYNRILMVGHVLEYHPAIVTLNQLIQSGELGKVCYIYSNRLSLGKIRREENILWSFAPHDIAVILRLVGAMPFQVVACGGSYLQPNIADVTITNLLFDNGVQAHIHVSWLHPFKEQRLVVVGTRKMASFNDVSKELVLYDQYVEVKDGQPVPIKGQGQLVPYSNAEPLSLECAAFLQAMATGTPPLTDGPSGLRVLKVLQAAQRSLITNGSRVNLPMEVMELVA